MSTPMADISTRISVLTVGDELLSGEVVDTNMQSIAKSLGEVGFFVSRHLTVGDDIDEIVGAVRALSAESDVLVVTGGLGPTNDDLTNEAVAKAVERPLEFHGHLAANLRAFFESMGRPMPDENLKQAHLPEGAREIPPAGGTAAGFMLEYDGALIAVLPGVPREMQDMLASDVIPEVSSRFAATHARVTRRIMTFGLGESELASLVTDRIGVGPVQYGFLVMGGPVVVKLTATGKTMSEALEIIESEQLEVEKRLGPLMYGVDDEPMEEIVGNLLREKGLTVAVAESLTAGMVGARIANVPGASDYLRGGVIAYANDIKREVLGLPGKLLADGAVQTEVAEAMAASVRKMFLADIGIATSGIAGPGTGGEKKPPGTACVALAYEGGVFSLERRLPGYRQMVRNIATLASLNLLRLHLLGILNPSYQP